MVHALNFGLLQRLPETEEDAVLVNFGEGYLDV
jgi:hypothetical protein